MKIAYLVLAHNTPNHLKRLICTLDSPDAKFFIHIDDKAVISPFRSGILQRNVYFLQNRVSVYWGDFSDVEATIRLLRAALELSPEPSYMVLLSGSDYPLKSPRYIENFVARHKGQQFINLVNMPCDALGKPIERLENYWLGMPFKSRSVMTVVNRLNELNRKSRLITRDYRRIFDGLVPYAGSQWWALTSAACRHILTFIDSRPDVVRFFRNTYLPDESFFHTIIGNSEFSKNVTRNLTFADWSRPSGGPAVIDMDHLHDFAKTEAVIADDSYGRGELLFARKFPDDSLCLTDFIDRQLIDRPLNHTGSPFGTPARASS